MTANNANNSVLVDSPEVDVHTLEKSNTGRVRGEVDSVMAPVATRVHDGVLTALEILVIHRVELAMELVNESSGRDERSVVPDSDK